MAKRQAKLQLQFNVITIIHCYFALLQHAESRMDVRGSVVLRDCIAQLCYANGALRSRNTIRTKTGSWDAPDPVRRKSAAAAPDAVYCAVIRFHQFSLHVRDYREYREFHHARKDGSGDIDHGNKPCFISRKIYLSRGTYQRGTKIHGEDTREYHVCVGEPR